MKAARALRDARLRAGLSQRALAERAGMPQSTVGRIESGAIDPRVGTLSRLVRACGYDLEVDERIGIGIDRTLSRELLKRSPAERVATVPAEARFLRQLDHARQNLGRGAPAG